MPSSKHSAPASRGKPDDGQPSAAPARHRGFQGGVGFTLSILLHLGVFAMLGTAPALSSRPVPQVVSLSVVTPPPPPEPATAEPEPEPEPEPPRPQRRAKRPAKPVPAPPAPVEAPPPTEQAPAPAAETPVDFGNLTLSADKGGWSSALGSGVSMNGPIGAPGQVTDRRRKGIIGGQIDGAGAAKPSVVDLSRRPEAPPNRIVSRELEQHYPRRARSYGVEGNSTIRLLVTATGRVRVLATLSDSSPEFGFGKACGETIEALDQRGLRWRPALDRNGRAVQKSLTFTCDFRVK